MSVTVPFDVECLDFEKGGGFVTVVTQDADSGTVLMVARADREAVLRTVATGEMHYHSRARGLWHKGATSGARQRVVSLSADCDGDALLARVIPVGPACHTGAASCFDGPDVPAAALWALDRRIAERAAELASGAPIPAPSYTQQLLRDRNLRLKKLGEEATELAVACADGDTARAREEAADLLYHLLVAVRPLGLGLEDLAAVLNERRRRAVEQ
jgi:phosphoribosyl-ATP pyrophosphohydrolase/phosphoribosyl-AMP cyclohydrolase